MKRILLSLTFLSCIVFAQEQPSTTDIKQNEISINLPISIFGEFPTLTYERLSSPDFGFGASAGFAASDNGLGSDLNFEVVPFARWYFLNSGNETIYGKKFFIEVNAGILGINDETYNESSNRYESDNNIGFGLGLGIGYKYVNTSNWIGSIYLGGGKNFGSNNNIEAYPHMGINIGKRF